MLCTVMDILGFYLIFIRTWRLATSTGKSPIGTELFKYKEEEQKYFPLKDLVSPHKVLVWMFKTVLSFKKAGEFSTAVILHKKFNWGLLWLLVGITIQFLSQCLERCGW